MSMMAMAPDVSSRTGPFTCILEMFTRKERNEVHAVYVVSARR